MNATTKFAAASAALFLSIAAPVAPAMDKYPRTPRTYDNNFRGQRANVFAAADAQVAPVKEADAKATAKVAVPPPPAVAENRPVIQLAILLDTSNSMDGLIDQAKSQLWKIVNQFVAVKRDGQRPILQVALIEYGNDGLPAKENHIRLVTPFTDDLDLVSKELFALKTNGGEEYCGAAIRAAVDRLAWSKSNADLKVVYIAGNEAFSQGPVDFRGSCKDAITKGIQINTIFCGPNAEGINTHWKDGAVLADGTFVSIDQNTRVAHIDAPQDKELAALGLEINKTFVPYGGKAKEGAENQVLQDGNAAAAAPGAAVQRAVAKASGNYRNSAWCLVDAVTLDNVDLSKVKDEELPENMRKMTLEQRKAYLAEKKAEREVIQKKVTELNKARDAYVAEEQKKLAAKSKAETLDSAVIGTVRKQAEAKNYKFE